MHQIAHLVAFVAEEAIDAVSVLFDSRFQVRRVTLIGLARDMHKAQAIAQVIAERLGVTVSQQVLPSAHRVADFKQAVAAVLDQAGPAVAVNLNTDDAVCAGLVLQCAQQQHVRVFAIETQYDRLVWLTAAEQAQPPLDIQDKLHSLDVFDMHGFDYISNLPSRGYANKLVCAQALLQLALLDDALIQRFVPKTGLTPHLARDTHALCELLKRNQLLVHNAVGRLEFAGFDAVSFVCGAWLEYAVYDTLTRLAPGLNVLDSHRGLCLRHRSSGFVCEFDIVFMRNNALHIIECKSGDSRGAKFLTHFEGITRTHGLRARTLLVSVDRLSDTLVATADGLGTGHIHGQQLLDLSRLLRDWIVLSD